MKIQIQTIPHSDQRYNSIGDYYLDERGTLQVRVSEMGLDHEFPVLIHELVEWFLCQRNGVPIPAIDMFDMQFEVERTQGQHVGAEPGDDPRAPYRREHRFAENVERQLVHEIGMSWQDYEARVEQDWITPRVP